MKKSFKRKLLLLFCFIYIATDIGRVSLIVNAENKKDSVIYQNSEIVINGVEDIELEKGSEFDPLSGIEALDKNGVNITSSLEVFGNVDVNVVGKYELEYRVESEFGETKSVTRNINVIEKNNIIIEKPVEIEIGHKEIDKAESDIAEKDIKGKKNKIVGVNNLTIKLGQDIDLMDGIKGFDEDGKDITEFIKVEGSIDFNTAGDYMIKYFVEKDGVLKEAIYRNITVVDSENIINIYSDEENVEDRRLTFSIIFSEKEKKFIIVNKSNHELSARNLKKTIVKLKVFDKNNKEKSTLNLLGKDRALIDKEDANNKFEKIEKIIIEDGDFIEIGVSDPKFGMDIQGSVQGDITMDKEDYSDGVDNIDYIKNVRFRINKSGLEAVYNNAPVIRGGGDTKLGNINKADLLAGIVVEDDHDGTIDVKDIKVTENVIKENESKIITYEVKDSWGRSTVVERQIDKIVPVSLNGNTIVVKGVQFAGSQDNIRFKIGFDTTNKRIIIPFFDGKILSNKEDEYFKFALYDGEGKEKTSVTLIGKDRSDSKKIDSIKNFNYEIGDYISLWHYDAPSNILIDGGVLESGDNDFAIGIPKEILERSRFKITNSGLQYVENEAPNIRILGSNPLIIKRGEAVDLLSDIEIEDSLESIDKSKVKISGFDAMIEGEQTIMYTVSDSWGVECTATRKIIVEPKNDLEGINIDFMTENGFDKVFTLSFDDISKRFVVKNKTNNKVNSLGRKEAIVIKVFNKYGKARKTFRIYGDSTGDGKEVSKLNNFSYFYGDYIGIWVNDIKNGVKIKGNILGKREEYDDGVDASDNLYNVRFKLDNEQFISTYNQAPIIVGPTNTTIRRGEKFEPQTQITNVTDDHDGTIDKSLVDVVFDTNSINKVGLHDVVYKVKDSWGREGILETKLTVNPAVGIEGNSIKLLSESEEMINVGFDSFTNKLKVLSYNSKVIIDGNNSDNAFEIMIYDNDGLTKKKTINFKFEEFIDVDKVKEIEEVVFDYGDKIIVKAYKNDKVSFKGTISSNIQTENYENGFSNDDAMFNTRFQIIESGLDAKYNYSPEITGIDDVRILLNSTFDINNGIKANDIEDGNLTNRITVSGSIDTKKLGIQKIYYTVTDDLGRSVIVERKVNVVNTYTSNIINLLSDADISALKFRINDLGNRFEFIERGNIQFDSSNLSEVIYKIKVFNENGEEVNSIELLGSDTAMSNKLDVLNEIQIREGYNFSLWGKVSKRIKVAGEMIKYPDIIEEYNDGIDNVEFMENVRFGIKGDKIEAIYNKSPELIIPTDAFEMYLGEKVDLTSGVDIIDDHDLAGKVSIEVKADLSNVGLRSVSLVATDSWGRKSKEYIRMVNIKNGLERHEIILNKVVRSNRPNVNDVSTFDSVPGVKIRFDETNKKIVAEQLSTGMFYWGRKMVHSIGIYRADGSVVLEKEILSDYTDQIQRLLNNISFDYGYYMKLSFTHSDTLSIKGQVLDEQQTYDPYVKIGYDLEKTKFVFTREGLKAEYEDDYKDDEKNNTISFYEVFAGRLGVRLKINPTIKKITADYDSTNPYFDNNNYNNNVIFKLGLYSSSGVEKFSRIVRGRQNVSSLANYWNNKEFELGDYILFTELNRTPKNLRITGKVLTRENQSLESFVDGVDDVEGFINTRFYLTSEGIVAFRNDGVEFNGIEEKNVTVGDNFNERDGVVGISQIDGDITDKITIESNVDMSNINSYNVLYKVTDSWGKVSKRERIINVRPKLYNNVIEVYKGNELTTPAITIRADNKTGKYIVNSNGNDELDGSLGRESAFKLLILDSNGIEKVNVELIGIDSINSKKLDIINGINYCEGDYIHVWRNPSSNTNSRLLETLKIKGAIDNAPEDYSDGIDNIDYMNNVIFKVRNEGLEAEYNAPATFIGVEDKVILKGEAFNPLSGVSAEDDKGIVGNIQVLSDVDINRIGRYTVTYTVVDKWGRVTSKIRNVEVASKLLRNNIEVYGKNSSGGLELKFILGFDTNTKKITVDIKSDTNLDMVDGIEGASILLYDRYGTIVEEVILTGNDKPSSSKLDKLIGKIYSNNMFIAFKDANHNNIKIKGQIVNNSEDYSDGFDTKESMSVTRFRLTDNGLTEARAKKSSFIGLTELNVKRGESPNLLEGVTISNSSDEIDYRKVKITNFDINKVGEQKATYSYIDSWGQVITGERKITVKYRNILEEIKINVLDSDKGEALVLRFDDLDGNFSIDIDNKRIDKLPLDTNLIEIESFDMNGTSIGEVIVNSNNIKTEELRNKLIEQVKDLRFDYLGAIHIRTYDSANRFTINGKISGDSDTVNEDYSDGVQNEEYIEHVRFIITEDGLESVHNEAPKILGLEIGAVKRGEEFDHFKGVSVTDDHDNGISSDSIIIDELVDIDSIGEQSIIYRVEDSWGRETVEYRTIFVTSVLEENILEFYSYTNKEKIFTLNFDSKKKTVKVEKGTSIESVDSSVGEDTAIEIVKYNKDEQEIGRYKLTGNDNKDSEVLNRLNGSSYDYGEYIYIYISQPKTGVKIRGDILKDTVLNEDYKDGIDDTEYMYNVRFKLTELGLEAIYNKAPELNVPVDKLIRYKELDINNYNLLEGITFSDDNTVLDESDIKISHNDISTLGTHEIQYELIDSWGRSSGIKSRQLEIKNALLRNYIEFERMSNTDLTWYDRATAFKLKFNIEEGTNGGRLEVSEASSEPFSHHSVNILNHYNFKIEGEDGTVKYDEFFKPKDRGTDAKISRLNGMKFEYGDKITIYQSMHKGFKIFGPVPNGVEDYSDGADLGDELKDTVFTIRKEGIVAEYNRSYIDSGDITNSIQWNLGINSNFGFRLKFDMKNKKIIGTDRDPQNEFNDTLERGDIFRIELKSKNDKTRLAYTVGSRSKPQAVLDVFNDQSIEYGEYIKLISYKKPKNLRVTGKLINNGIQNFEDYEDGVEDVEKLSHVRFYFTPDGLYVYENEAPKILGATDLNIIKGESFNVRDGVDVSDDLDAPGDIKLRIDDSTFDSSMIGAHQVTYVATDTGGRSSTYDRFLFITAKPVITLKDSNSIYVEKGSINSSGVNDYLKSIISITDEEDDDVKVAESLKITGSFNPEAEGVYPINYKVTDSDKFIGELSIDINVVKTINVSAPISVPFQVVTNLKAPEAVKEEGYMQQVVTNQKNPTNNASEFVSAQLRILNNNTSEVEVSIKEFNRTEGELEIVKPESISDWNSLTAEESMSKMALGIYNSSGLIGATSNADNPVWLTTNIQKTNLGILQRKDITSGDPAEARLSLVSKHGSRFKGGKTKGKFNIIFEFE